MISNNSEEIIRKAQDALEMVFYSDEDEIDLDSVISDTISQMFLLAHDNGKDIEGLLAWAKTIFEEEIAA